MSKQYTVNKVSRIATLVQIIRNRMANLDPRQDGYVATMTMLAAREIKLVRMASILAEELNNAPCKMTTIATLVQIIRNRMANLDPRQDGYVATMTMLAAREIKLVRMAQAGLLK